MSNFSSKTRALTAFAHQQPDRVPLDYSANPGIDLRLKQHFGLRHDDNEGLLQALNIDFRSLWPGYIGPQLHPELPGRQVSIWGIRMHYIEHPSGSYWDYCDFPLKDADLETIQSWPMPSPDDFDYAALARQARQHSPYCVVLGHAGVGDIINSTGMIRTMEQVLVDLISDDPVFLRYIERKVNIDLEVARRSLEAAPGSIDMLFIGEDLGTQRGPMISLPLFRKHIRPRLQGFASLAKAYGIPLMFHSCGSSSWVFDDLIDMGVQVIDTLQPEAAMMQPAYLKQRFSARLSFHGCISTGGPLAHGTAADTVQNVRDVLKIMKPGGGYALAPSHMIQDNTPTENVLAMYETALKDGSY